MNPAADSPATPVDGRLPTVVLVLASVSWGLTWMPLKFLNGLGFEAIPIIVVTHSLLVAMMVVPGLRWSVLRANYKPLCGIALAGGTAIISFSAALVYGEVVRVMVLFYLLPVWGVLGGRVFLGERIGTARAFGALLAIGGAFLIVGGFAIFQSPPSWVDGLALLSGLCFAANNILFRGVSSVGFASKLLVMFCGCVLIGGVALLIQGGSLALDLPASAWLWLVLYGVTWLLLGNVGSQWAVERMEAGRSSIILIVELVAAVISATLIGHERLSPLEWLGCALVMAAAFMETSRSPRTPQASGA